MNDFDKLLFGVVVLAIVAVVVASKQSTSAINSIGSTLASLSANVVGSASTASQN